MQCHFDQVDDLLPLVVPEGLPTVIDAAPEQHLFDIVGNRHRWVATIKDCLNLLELQRSAEVNNRKHVDDQQLGKELDRSG